MPFLVLNASLFEPKFSVSPLLTIYCATYHFTEALTLRKVTKHTVGAKSKPTITIQTRVRKMHILLYNGPLRCKAEQEVERIFVCGNFQKQLYSRAENRESRFSVNYFWFAQTYALTSLNSEALRPALI